MEKCSVCGKTAKSIKYHFWRMHGDGQTFDPNRGYADGERLAWNKGHSKDTHPSIKQQIDTYKSRGYNSSGCCTAEWNKSDEGRLAHARGGGYRENAGRSKKFRVFDTQGNLVTIQSTYELAVFEILCELGLRWSRPKALKYNGKNYFADFYLLDFNVWLDPKNSYKAVQDRDKIHDVIQQNDVKLYVLLEHQINKQFIASVAQ